MKINWSRAIMGGILAGLIVNICEYVVSGLLLGEQWKAALKALNPSIEIGAIGNSAFLLWGFLIGMYSLWLYVTIRPRFGQGVKTAIIAGIATWIPGTLLAETAPAAMHLFRYRLIAADTAVGLVAITLGTIAGAALYKERAEQAPVAAAAAGR